MSFRTRLVKINHDKMKFFLFENDKYTEQFYRSSYRGNHISISFSGICHFYAQLTVIVEMNVVWQRLVLRREVGSSVFKELPFHPVFIFFFFPPDRKQDHKKNENISSENYCTLLSPR